MTDKANDLGAVFDEHMRCELVLRDVDATMRTMTANPYLTHGPGIAPTGKYVELPHVVIVRFEQGKVAHEHIYWDQASLLVQVGLLDPRMLPVTGVEQARKLLDVRLPMNTLLMRTTA